MKIKNIFLSAILFLYGFNFNYAQDVSLDWVQNFGATGGNNNSQAKSLGIDNAGNVYSFGTFVKTIDFDTSASNYSLTSTNNDKNMFLRKTDTNGNFIWAFKIGEIGASEAQSAVVDENGNIYIVGTYNNSNPNFVDFDPGVGVTNLGDLFETYGQQFIAKYDTNRNLIWVKEFGCIGNQETFDVQLDNAGNIYLVGYFRTNFNVNTNAPSGIYLLNPGTDFDAFILKLNSSGNYIWAKQIGGLGYQHARSITFDDLNNVYVLGDFTGTVDLNPNTGVQNATNTNNTTDGFLLKLTSNGSFIYAKQITSSGGLFTPKTIRFLNNNIYLNGTFNGTTDFDLTVNNYNLTPISTNAFVAKYDLDCDLIWAKKYGNGGSLRTNKLLVTELGIYTTGKFLYTSDFDPSANTFNLSSTYFNTEDAYINKLDLNGNFINAYKMGGHSVGYDIAIDQTNNIYTFGRFNGHGDFDPTVNTFNISSVGSKDFFIQKLNQNIINAPYCESFENNAFFTNYWEQEITDNFDWTRHTGNTTSFSTGPDAAIDGSYYIYTETSSPRTYGDQAIIYSPEINISNLTTPTLEFNYHMYGNGMNPDGTINVAISTDNGVTWASIFNQTANQGNQWNYFNVDLTPYIAGNNVKFRITGRISSMTGNVFENDFAIDNFCVKENSLLEHFVTTWQTDNVGTSNNSSITIPTKNTETYNYDVDWDNDGVFEDKGVTGNIVHDYGVGNEGTKTVRIRGQFPSIFFNGSFDKDKILQVNQWGNQKWTTFNNAFRRCYNLDGNATDTPDLSKVTNMHNTFSYAYNFNGNISNWDTSNITNLRETFNRATSFNQDISTWDVSNVSNMYRTFYIATHFNQNLANWNIENASNMDGMLSYSGLSANNYDNTLIGWQSQNVTNNITLGADTLEYCLSEVQRQTLIDTNLWTINGDSKGCDDCSQGLTIWNGTNWSNGTPTLLKSTRLDADYDTAINGSFSSCNCQIIGGATLNIRNGNYIHANDTHSNGNILIENNGSFTQTSNTATLGGIGYFKLERETTPYTEYDYTYWSSPTRFETVLDAFNTNSLLIAGASHINAANDDNFSPTNRIYQFNAANFNDNNNDTFDDEGDDWQNVPSNEFMTAGKGYIVMGAGADFPFNTNFATGLQQRIFFEGRFNTGNINYTVFTDASPTDHSQNLNLIGNPYPSAIDINLLMKNNLTRLEGTFYFWTHDSPISGANPGPHAFDFTNNDYAVATSNGIVFNSVSSGTTGTSPRGYIATAQSVMATALNQGDITFTNDIRIPSPNTSYRPANQPNLDRIWLNLTNTGGTFMQQLITFYENGNPSFENGLDGERPNNANNYDFYSIIENDTRRFAIQTLNEFDINQTIKLGVEIIDSGIFTISIDRLEGIFLNGQTIFLQDNETQTIHNLSNSDYTFYIHQTEELNNRFVLKFTNQTASNEEFVFSDISIYPNPSKNGIFTVSTNKNSKITYSIYSLNGKKLISDKTLNSQNTLDLSNFSQGIYIIKLNTNNKQVVKKLIINIS